MTRSTPTGADRPTPSPTSSSASGAISGPPIGAKCPPSRGTCCAAARRLDWWLARAEAPPTGARLRVAAHLLLSGTRLDAIRPLFSGGRFAAGSLDADEARALEAIDGHTLDHPHMPDAVRLEIPDWLLPRLQARFGAALEPELDALLEAAPLDLRVNLLRGTRDDAIRALAREDIEVTATPLSPWGLRTPGRRMVTTGKAFRSGLVEIQDEGSQLVALAVGALPEMRVCDLCAGAGGKTLAIAMTMANRGHVVACDISASRLDGAVKRLRRAGVHNAERHLLVAGDKWAKRRAGSFDRVLVDAPCTGTGTWRRNPRRAPDAQRARPRRTAPRPPVGDPRHRRPSGQTRRVACLRDLLAPPRRERGAGRKPFWPVIPASRPVPTQRGGVSQAPASSSR